MASIRKSWLLIILTVSLILLVSCDVPNRAVKTSRRIRIPFLGIGPRCNGCPSHFCDDDPEIIHGYCCGCAKFYDNLPIKCSHAVNCPLNTYDLCEDYEYMMHCCCSNN